MTNKTFWAQYACKHVASIFKPVTRYIYADIPYMINIWMVKLWSPLFLFENHSENPCPVARSLSLKYIFNVLFDKIYIFVVQTITSIKWSCATCVGSILFLGIYIYIWWPPGESECTMYRSPDEYCIYVL